MMNLNETLEGLVHFKSVVNSTYQEIESLYKQVIDVHEELNERFKDLNNISVNQTFEDLSPLMSYIIDNDFKDLEAFIQNKINILESYFEL